MDIRKILAITLLALALAAAGLALADGAEAAEAAAGTESPQMTAARDALNKAQYEKAASLMREVYEQDRSAAEAGNALYWEAFARYRLKRTEELKRAVELLQLQQKEFAEAETAREGEALLARLYAEMSERGEIEGITGIERMSEEDRQREEIRIEALHALMRMNPDKALPILEDIVRGNRKGSPEMRSNALFVLCRIDDPRTEDLLIELLQQPGEASLKAEVVMCLSMKTSDRALDAIVNLLENSNDPEVDEAALMAIGRNGGDRAYALLAAMVRNPDKSSDLRGQALFGLAQSGHDAETAKLAADLLGSTDDRELMEAALYTLSRLDDAVPDQVFRDLINNPRADDDLRAQALYFAAERSELSLDFLLDIYHRADSRDLKLQVCHVMSRMDDEDAALDALITIARQEKDPEIRQNVMFWIGRFDNDKAAAYLVEVINQE